MDVHFNFHFLHLFQALLSPDHDNLVGGHLGGARLVLGDELVGAVVLEAHEGAEEVLWAVQDADGFDGVLEPVAAITVVLVLIFKTLFAEVVSDQGLSGKRNGVLRDGPLLKK